MLAAGLYVLPKALEKEDPEGTFFIYFFGGGSLIAFILSRICLKVLCPYL